MQIYGNFLTGSGLENSALFGLVSYNWFEQVRILR